MATAAPQRQRRIVRKVERLVTSKPIGPQGGLVGDIDVLTDETEARVLRQYDTYRGGTLTQDQFVKTSSRTVGRANARATTLADQYTAADLRTQTGRPHRPIGLRPPPQDQARLEKSIGKITRSDPITGRSAAEDHEIRKNRLGRLARNEPASAAQNAAQKAMDVHQGSIQGWVRAVGGSAVCPLCQTWADGVVRSTKVHMVRHKGCRCMPRPVAKKVVRRRTPVGVRGRPTSIKGLIAAARGPGITGADVAVYLGAGVATKFVTQEVAHRVYGRTRVMAGGRRAYRRLTVLEQLLTGNNSGQLRVVGSLLAEARKERRALIAKGVDVERNVRELEYLEGGFLHHRDVYRFLDELKSSEHSKEELDALWEYAGAYTGDPEVLIAKGPVARFHRHLRDPERHGPLDPERQKVMDLVDQAIARNVTKRDVVVWRGAILPDEEVFRLRDLEPGERITDKAPMFTGLTEARAFPHAARREFGQEPRQFEDHHGVMFRIQVPKGMPAMHSPFGETLAAHPKVPFVLRAIPGFRTITGLGARKIDVPIGLIANQVGLYKRLPVKWQRKNIRLRVPFIEYFNKEELVLPRDTALHFIRSYVRDDGLLGIDAEVIKPTLSPPISSGAGPIVNMARFTPKPIQRTLRPLAQIAADLRRQFPELDVDLGPTNEVQANLMHRALTDLGQRYPQVMAKLETFRATPDVPLVHLPRGRTQQHVWNPGGVGMSGPRGPLAGRGNTGQRFLLVNPYYAQDSLALRRILTEDPREFAMRDMEDVVFHEFGHHLFYDYTDRLYETFAAEKRSWGQPVWPDPGDDDAFMFAVLWGRAVDVARADIANVVELHTGHPLHSYDGARAVERLLSKYAISLDPDRPGEIDIDELVGEAFAQTMVGKYAKSGDLFSRMEASDLARAIVARIDRRLTELGVDLPDALGPPYPPGGVSMIRTNRPGPRINVTVPTTKSGAAAAVPGRGPVMHPDLIPDKNVVDTIRRQARVPGFEDFADRIADAERSPVAGRVVLRDIVKRMANNIFEWAERSQTLSPRATQLHSLWYPFAHGWLNDLADLHNQNGISRPGAYAVTAALSPQADWANNVAWAKWVITAISDDVKVTRQWIDASYALELAKGRQLGRGGGLPRRRSDLIGKRLSEITDPYDVAYALRARYDHDPLYRLGGAMGFGNPAHKAAPNDTSNIAKAVMVARDGSLENIDKVLGGQKVRSFYNNLANPLDDIDLNVTIDSHHFGVANALPLVSKDPFISSGKLNITDTPYDGEVGIGGTYSLVVQATRLAAARFNRKYDTDYLPNQIQSIVWEMHRALYDEDHRTIEIVADLSAIRTRLARKQITPARARALIEQTRLRHGALTESEILVWFEADINGAARPTLGEMRRT